MWELFPAFHTWCALATLKQIIVCLRIFFWDGEKVEKNYVDPSSSLSSALFLHIGWWRLWILTKLIIDEGKIGLRNFEFFQTSFSSSSSGDDGVRANNDEKSNLNFVHISWAHVGGFRKKKRGKKDIEKLTELCPSLIRKVDFSRNIQLGYGVFVKTSSSSSLSLEFRLLPTHNEHLN